MALDVSKISDRAAANVLATLDTGKGAIATLIGLNGNATGDTPILLSLPAGKTTYLVTDIYVIQTFPANVLGGYNYTGTLRSAANGGGTQIALIAPSFSGTILNTYHAGGVGSSDTNAFNQTTLYVNTTVPQGAALTMNLYIVGLALY